MGKTIVWRMGTSIRGTVLERLDPNQGPEVGGTSIALHGKVSRSRYYFRGYPQ